MGWAMSAPRKGVVVTRDRIQFQLVRLGWPAALGLALLLGAFACDQWLNQPLEEELANRQAAAARRALVPLVRERVRKPVALPRERVEAALPRLFAAAHHHGLALDEGRYAETGKRGDARLHIDLPVSGAYPALRAFLAEVLDDNPALELESLELTREDIGTTELEAHLRFVLNLEAMP
jgi:hypothetical protein